LSSREQAKAAARAEREAAEQQAAAGAARTQRLRLLGGVLAAAVAIVVVVIAVSSSGGGSKTHASKTGAVQGVAATTSLLRGIPQQGTVIGSPKAPVTLVEYADLKCPVCQEFTLQTFPTIVRKYVRTGKLRIEFRIQTFVGAPGDSTRAARFALAAAKQNRFWNFADLFYRNQLDESQEYVNDAFLRRIGGGVPGLDVASALAARTGSAIAAQISAASSAFSDAGFNGTPSFELGRSGTAVRPFNLTSFNPAQLGGAIDKLLG
jgi:protein-disulfide isomerase